MSKLAVEHPEPLLRANGLAASLTFIDFFDTNTQRTAAATAANICRCALVLMARIARHKLLEIF
jgi:E3 ubiquitin-protein ligase TRIP12